ncbi:MAG: hypothetical protein OEU36_16255, partial [Gammaproteobacteria bacterium]|nr:hypothetical protein [Gammaproteobacteria bacterium]
RRCSYVSAYDFGPGRSGILPVPDYPVVPRRCSYVSAYDFVPGRSGILPVPDYLVAPRRCSYVSAYDFVPGRSGILPRLARADSSRLQAAVTAIPIFDLNFPLANRF